MARDGDFSERTKEMALARQQSVCGLCEATIVSLGRAGQRWHEYGEIAHAHHLLPLREGGTATVDNCVVLCSSCHYTVHEGGNYRFGTVISKPSDYPHFSGKKRGR